MQIRVQFEVLNQAEDHHVVKGNTIYRERNTGENQ